MPGSKLAPVAGSYSRTWLGRENELESKNCRCRVEEGDLRIQLQLPSLQCPGKSIKDSLHYYLYSDALAREARKLDPNGIPEAWYRVTSAAYWPAYIAWYGLVQLGHYLRRGDEVNLSSLLLKQVSWQEKNAVLRSVGTVVRPMNFGCPNGAVPLKAPWISAYTQGLVISALVRTWFLTKRPELLELLQNSEKVFELDVQDPGVRILLEGYTLYTEIPGGPLPGILECFITTLIGLYDLYVETEEPVVGRLFEEGIAELKYALPRWDYRSKWSWYDCAYLSPPAYRNLNFLLLEVLAGLSSSRAWLNTSSDGALSKSWRWTEPKSIMVSCSRKVRTVCGIEPGVGRLTKLPRLRRRWRRRPFHRRVSDPSDR